MFINVTKLTCEKCERVFDTYRKLNGHKGWCGKLRITSPRQDSNKKWINPTGHFCRYCSREFESGISLGGHTIRCKMNPNSVKTNGWTGKKHEEETKKKQRLAQISHIEKRKGHQMKPSYNPSSIPIIEDYGRKNGFKFQHAENGGEFYIADLGYWVDAYDSEKNVVLEYDESHHFDANGNLKQKDLNRQREIENHLGCKFIRIRE